MQMRRGYHANKVDKAPPSPQPPRSFLEENTKVVDLVNFEAIFFKARLPIRTAHPYLASNVLVKQQLR